MHTIQQNIKHFNRHSPRKSRVSQLTLDDHFTSVPKRPE